MTSGNGVEHRSVKIAGKRAKKRRKREEDLVRMEGERKGAKGFSSVPPRRVEKSQHSIKKKLGPKEANLHQKKGRGRVSSSLSVHRRKGGGGALTRGGGGRRCLLVPGKNGSYSLSDRP